MFALLPKICLCLFVSIALGEEGFESQSGISKQIHFIYKTSIKQDLPPSKQKFLSSWEKYNPGYSITIWDDEAAEQLVEEFFPQHLQVFHQLTLVERTDMLRYMIIHVHGGVYADLDVECYRSVDSWHENVKNGKARVIVGVEADVTAAEENDFDLIRPQQISQWVFAGSKGHDVFSCAVNLVAKRFQQFNVAGANTIWNARETLKLTGPGVFTDCVIQHVTAVGEGSIADTRYQRAAKIGDTIVFNVDAFAPFQRHSGGIEPDGFSRMYDVPDYMQHYISDLGILVRHWFSGSWKASAAAKSSSVSLSRKPISSSVERPWPWDRVFVGVLKYPVVFFLAVLLLGLGNMAGAFIVAHTPFPAKFIRTSSMYRFYVVAQRSRLKRLVWIFAILCIWNAFVSVVDYQRLRKTNDNLVHWYQRNIADPPPRATFVSMSVADTITAGEPMKVRLVYFNSGEAIWYMNEGYRVKAFGVHAHKLQENIDLVGAGIAGVPGTTVSYEYYVWLLACPADEHTPLDLHFQWVDSNGRPFGDASPTIALTCMRESFDAAFVSFQGMNSSHELAESEAKDVIVTMRNTGARNWTSNNEQHVMFKAQSQEMLLLHDIDDKEVIQPGQVKHFVFSIRFLKSCPRSATLQWQMYSRLKQVQNAGGEWVTSKFGAKTPPLIIRCKRPTDSASFWYLSHVPDYVNFGVNPLPIVHLAFRNDGYTTWRRGQHAIRALHSTDSRYPELDMLPVDEVPPGAVLHVDMPLKFDVRNCNPTKSVAVQWMMATIHGTAFGEVSPKKEVYCSNLPCVDYAWHNVISGSTFMEKSDEFIKKFALKSSSQGIPRIIHQSWMSEFCNWDQRKWISSWLEYHPDWLYVFWQDAENDALVRQFAPELLPLYKSFPRDIYRVDFIRYIMLSIFGGVYADVDVQALQPLDPLIAQHEAFVGVEPTAHSLFFYGQNQTMCNAIMASRKGHPFWEQFIVYIGKRTKEFVAASKLNSRLDVIELTGPKAMEYFWRDYILSTDGITSPLTVLQDVNVMPLVARYQRGRLQAICRELNKILVPAAVEECRRLESNDYVGKQYTNETYTVHHWTCSWCK